MAANFDGHTTSEQVIEVLGPQAKGKTFVLVGAGQPSIGSQLALYLAQGKPSHILIASRTAKKVEPVLQKLAEIDSTVKTTYVAVDLTDRDQVRGAAQKILAAAPKIDVLVNSAGAMATKAYTLDKHGVEFQLSANHIGFFLLANLLVPGLLAAASESSGSRVINLTSSGYRLTPFKFDDWNYSGGKTYEPWTAYGQAKTANILFAYGLTKRLQPQGVTSTATHPGYNGDTHLGDHLTWDDYGEIDAVFMRNRGLTWEWEEPRFKDFSQIAATSLIACLDPELPAKSPAYLQNSQIHECEEHARDPEAVEKLWKLSEEIVGQKFEY